MTNTLFSPFTFPNGVTVQNRLVKAAMEENMAEAGQIPGRALINLYTAWANADGAEASGPGMILTGNVMIDPTAMTGPGGVVLEHGTPVSYTHLTLPTIRLV